jgi:hypothetical protein
MNGHFTDRHHKPELILPPDFDFESELRAAKEGRLRDVRVRIDQSRECSVHFIDVARLARELENASHAGREFYAAPGMIVEKTKVSGTFLFDSRVGSR